MKRHANYAVGLDSTAERLRDKAFAKGVAHGKRTMFTAREKSMLRRALSLLLSDEIEGERTGDREAAESAQAKL